MRRAAKVDSNHAEIVAALRQVGCSVQSLAAVGGGCPDLLVGRGGKAWLLEVKAERGRMTPDQVVWFGLWGGPPVVVVRSAEDALQVVGGSYVA